MDKDLLRIVIIATGSVVILGIIFWSAYKNRRPRRHIDFYDKGNPLDNIDSSLILNTDNDEFDVVPLGSAYENDEMPEADTVATDSIKHENNNFVVPKIIQFSIVAEADASFNGQDLADAFEQVGLIYGSMKVFERLDEKNRVDYAVASIVEPGTFPESDLELYDFPGIVFFLQPGELENPLGIFDELLETLGLLAAQLGGVIWDHQRQVLTEETIQKFRAALKTS